MYTVHKKCANSVRWRCCKYSSLKCRAILVTTLATTDPELKTEHNHPANEENVKVTKCVQKMKQRARDTLAKPVQIFTEAVSVLEDSTRAEMPTEKSAKRTLQNCKGPNMPNLRSLQKFVIEGAIYVDGNFSLAPPLFTQLYVVRVKVQEVFVICAYSLLQKKTQSTYETMLRAIVSACEEKNLFPDPTNVHIDFERTAIQAIKEVFGDHIIIRGCFYHLTQSTHRKLQELGLEQRYRENAAFSKFCGMLDSLVFLLLQDVDRGMTFLKDNITECAQEFVDYFDATYVSGTYRRVGNNNDNNVRLRNIPPSFPPETWNVYEETVTDGERTNNHTEGWNYRFSHLKMRQELAVDKTKLQQQDLGRLPKKRKRLAYVIVQTRLKNLCREFSEGERDLKNFLNAVSHNIRF
ncbi:hypothetical protein RN001_001474 [Aquatica leii]|uniref:MULE transposase domain-containing protein n=1 Tax=Aquatica leii TaxID=1421715 RepID=A0AAN7PGB6_9COLE|nr:hypothetical protein RN001_001474 [Aquatica leii]